MRLMSYIQQNYGDLQGLLNTDPQAQLQYLQQQEQFQQQLQSQEQQQEPQIDINQLLILAQDPSNH